MDLAQFIQKAGSGTPKVYFPFSLVEGGLPQGGLIELSGAAGGGKLEALMRFLAENPTLETAWVEEGATTYPCAFPQHGVSLERVLFVNAEASSGQASRLMDCAHQILRSQIFRVLVVLAKDSIHSDSVGFYPHNHTTLPRDSLSSESRGLKRGEIELRRLQIAAEKSGTLVFILCEEPSTAHCWPLTAQFQVSRMTPSFGDLRGELRVKVLKYNSQPREKMKTLRSSA